MDIICPNMSPHGNVLLLFSLWASVQEGLGLPVMKEWTEDTGSVPSSPGVRSKRCACSSFLDSECHYFCHLDIIWINTPSKTSVYGLGVGPSRRRRSTTRCSCANSDDHICSNFCQHRFVPSQTTTPKKTVWDKLHFLKTAIKISPSSQNAPGGQDLGPAAQWQFG